MRVIAIDWSGAAHTARSHIWLAESIAPGELVRLEAGRDRRELAEYLLLHTDVVAIGLDFAFSFPAWFLAQLGIGGAQALWHEVANHGEAWLAACEPPFWGRRGHPRCIPPGAALRRTELAVPRTTGIAPKSIFQIGGAGTVGTGSIRGMPLLHKLASAGATVWPFATCNSKSVVVEIYPRLLTGPVRKANPLARAELVARRYPRLDPAHARLAALSEDAFDAAVSALVMIEHAADLESLPDEPNPVLRLEGRIWHPAWRQDRP